MKLIKAIMLTMCMCIFVTACASNTQTEDTSADITEDLELADVSSLNSDLAGYFLDFLKLGSLDEAAITELHPDWVASTDGTKEMWDNEQDIENMVSYWRDITEEMSYYSRTFTINTPNIERWINVELTAIDTLLCTVHERQRSSSYTWDYLWNGDNETAVLKVYSTGETGHYVGLVSFSRRGITSVDQIVTEGVASNEASSVQ